MWTALWGARIITNVLIDIIPGINENYPILVVLGVSLLLEFASTTMLACALSFVQLSTVRNWFTEHFPRRGRDEKLMILYRITNSLTVRECLHYFCTIHSWSQER